VGDAIGEARLSKRAGGEGSLLLLLSLLSLTVSSGSFCTVATVLASKPSPPPLAAVVEPLAAAASSAADIWRRKRLFVAFRERGERIGFAIARGACVAVVCARARRY
jgi:hypothetical protein